MIGKTSIVTEFKRPKMYSARSLEPISRDYRLFTLAGLYMPPVDVPFDITMQFRAEVENFSHIHVATEKPILTGVPRQYEHFLEGIAKEAATEFLAYMRRLKFVNKQTGLYSEVIWQDVPLASLVSLNCVMPQLVTYLVFLPDTNKYRYGIRTDNPPSLYCTRQVDAEIIKRGEQVLKGEEIKE